MNKKVFVLGELNVDIIVTGPDVTPEWNREKLVDSFDLVMGSSSAITACGLSGLGLEVHFVGVAGMDEFGRFVVNELQRHRVNTRNVRQDPSLKTGVGLSLSTAQDRALLTFMGSIPCLAPHDLPETLLQEADHIHFGSYFLQTEMRSCWESLFKQAKSAGVTTSFDTGWDPQQSWHREEIYRLLKYTDLFMPSEDELLRISGKDCIEDALQALPPERGDVAVKLGSKGAVWFKSSGERLESKAFPIVPLDTTGAGDSFDAGMIYAYLHGFEAMKALEWANACGALATQRIGGAASVPDFNDVQTFIESHGKHTE